MNQLRDLGEISKLSSVHLGKSGFVASSTRRRISVENIGVVEGHGGRREEQSSIFTGRGKKGRFIHQPCEPDHSEKINRPEHPKGKRWARRTADLTNWRKQGGSGSRKRRVLSEILKYSLGENKSKSGTLVKFEK